MDIQKKKALPERAAAISVRLLVQDHETLAALSKFSGLKQSDIIAGTMAEELERQRTENADFIASREEKPDVDIVPPARGRRKKAVAAGGDAE